MTIKIKKDRIEFVSDEGITYTLKETIDGFSFDGVIEASQIFPNEATVNILQATNHFQGTEHGYTSGGRSPSTLREVNTIDRFPFAEEGNASDVGDMVYRLHRLGSCSSATNGYVIGGSDFTHVPGSGQLNFIQKYPFTSSANATDIGDLVRATNGCAGTSSTTHGYGSTNGQIDKFPFSSDTNASLVGTQFLSSIHNVGVTSATHGYSAGNWPGGGAGQTIEKHPFASDTNGIDVGDLIKDGGGGVGVGSSNHGYVAGRLNNAFEIEKFPFSTDTNSTLVGDLSPDRVSQAMGISGVSTGYASGGTPLGVGATIQKWPFANDTNASLTGYLTIERLWGSAQQT